MVFIITGARDTGKTTRLLKIFKEKKGAGIASLKNNSGENEEYYILFLGSSQKKLLLASEDNGFAYNSFFLKFKRFYFNTYAFKKAELYILQSSSLGLSPIFLDEVGELEFNGMGFHDICLKLMGLQTDVYVTVRENYLDRFLNIFKPANYEILKKEE